MIRSNKVKIIFVLFFFFNAFAFPQEKQADHEKKLREEILAVYQSKGELGLRDFAKNQKDKLTNKFIADFANVGMIEIKEEWLIICKILAEEQNDAKTLATVLFRIGEYYSSISDYKNAIDYFDNSFYIFQKLKHPVGQGNVYLCKGDIYAQIGENQKAFEMYDKALSFFEKAEDSLGQGNVYLGKASIYSLTAENSKALEMYDKALVFFEKARYINGQGNVYMEKGATYFYTGDNSTALQMYDKALICYEKTGLSIGLGNVYLRKGVIYSNSGDNPKALEMYDKALPFFEKSADAIGQGNVYFSKGDAYLTIGENSKASEMYDKALPFFDKAADSIGQGNVYLRKGDIYFNTGNNLNGIMMYDQSLSFYKKSGDILGQGNVYKSKGNIYLKIGDNSKALELFDKALPFFEKAGDIVGQGNVFHSKGAIYFHMKVISKALEMYDKALPFFENNEDLLGQGNVYSSKGYIYFYTGENSKALDMYNKALLFYEKAEEPIGQGIIYLRKGEIYLKIGDNSKAVEIYDKSSLFFKNAGDIELESFSLHGKAKGLVKLGKKYEALELFEKGIANLENVREQAAFSEMKRVFMEGVYDQYEEVFLFTLGNKYYEKGFNYAESMRARVYLDQMAEGLVGLEKGLKPDLKEARDLLVGKLSALSRQIQETGGKDEKKLLELKEEYRKVESEFDDLLIKIRLENPLYAAVNYPQPISVQDLQKDILKEGEAMLSYFISQDEAYAFVISKNNFHVQPLKIKEKEVNSSVERYLLAIKGNNANDTKRYGSLLYEKLFKPLEKYLEKTGDIIIVPSGQLETIPFESLIIDNKKPGPPIYLLEKYRLKYVQSATLLSILRKNYNGDSAAKGFIGFGDPVYDYENFKQNKPEQGTATKAPRHQELFYNNIFGVPLCLSAFVAVSNTTEKEEEVVDEIKEIHRDRFARAGGVMDRLTKSGEEIQSIAQLFEKESLATKIYLRDQAAEENARADNMKDFAYIHFSCHGLLNDDFQCLVLSQSSGSKEDGYFTLNEIMNCDYNAKLIVLSACQTGSGKMARGEGITGLTRAFMYAGSPAVVASLWDVDDAATKEFMVKFYSNMLEKNLDKVEALRQAKLELLKNEKYSSPLSWSAFVMYGE